jgi:hypothetical protein
MTNINQQFLDKLDRVQLKNVLRKTGGVRQEQISGQPTNVLRRLLTDVLRRKKMQDPELFTNAHTLTQLQVQKVAKLVGIAGAAVALTVLANTSTAKNVLTSATSHMESVHQALGPAKNVLAASAALSFADGLHHGAFGEEPASFVHPAYEFVEDVAGNRVPAMGRKLLGYASNISGSLIGGSHFASALLGVGTSFQGFASSPMWMSAAALVLMGLLGQRAISSLTGLSESRSQQLVDRLLRAWAAERPAYTEQLQEIWKSKYSKPCKDIKQPEPCAAKRIRLGRFSRSKSMCQWERGECKPTDEMKLRFKPGKEDGVTRAEQSR